MKNMKRIIALAMVFLLLLTSACTGNQNSKADTSKAESSKAESSKADSSKADASTPSETSTPEEPTGPEPYELPIVANKVTLTMFSVLDGKASVSLSSMEENFTVQYYEELSNVHIQFFHPSSATSLTEALNTMIASGEITDIIFNIQSATDGIDALISNGIILRLNELIDKWGYYYNKVFEENPGFKASVTTYDGNIGMYSTSRLDEPTRFFESYVVRKDWLDTLKIEKPTKVDEWYDMLTAIKTGDPNGNGQADELPFVSNSNEEMGIYRLSALFGFNSSYYKQMACSIFDGKVVFASEAPGFTDFVTTMNKWYAEGLLDPETFSTDAAGWKEKVLTDRAGSFYGKMNGGIGTLLGSYDYEKGDPNFNLEPMAYPITSEGKSFDFFSQEPCDNGGAAISAKCKEVEAAVKYLDYMYSPEGQIMMDMGKEGYTYEFDSNGVAHYTDLITKAEGLSLVQAIAKYCIGGIMPRMVNDKYYWDAVMSYDQQRMVYPTVKDSTRERKCPQSLKYSQEEQSRLNTLMADIESYYKEGMQGFVTGAKPLSEVEAFRAQLKTMGLDEAVAIMQAAYDRYIAA